MVGGGGASPSGAAGETQCSHVDVRDLTLSSCRHVFIKENRKKEGTLNSIMCGEMGRAVLRALTGALLCGMVSDAAHLQRYQIPSGYEVAYVQKPLREHEKPQDLSNVPGAPGVDYPIYHAVPDTSFSCEHVPIHPGMYANVETGCQAYHVCHDGREGHQGASFLCTNGTLFDQAKFACDWWYNVDCSQAVSLYKLNADPLKNPYVPKPKPEELQDEAIYYKQL